MNPGLIEIELFMKEQRISYWEDRREILNIADIRDMQTGGFI